MEKPAPSQRVGPAPAKVSTACVQIDSVIVIMIKLSLCNVPLVGEIPGASPTCSGCSCPVPVQDSKF